MKNISTFVAFISLSFAVSVTILADGDKKNQMKNLPPAVQATVKEQSKGATIRGFAKEKAKGKTVYELELKVDGHNRDMMIDESGNILSVEEQVELKDLPAAVQATILKQTGKGTIVIIESLTEDGTLIGYEAAIKTGGKSREVKISPDGKLMK
jgi:uncharacterized membrane protein YkoI